VMRFTDTAKVVLYGQAPAGPHPWAMEGEGRGIAAGAERLRRNGGWLEALTEGQLVSQDDERRPMRLADEATEKPDGQLVRLAGEPGVGKTRLAQEVTLEARNRGFLVAAGSCYEQRQAAPFYPFLEALPVLYSACPPALRSEVPRRWPHVGRLLPDAGIPVPPALADGIEEQERLFRAVTDFLRAAAETAPVALAFDDLHWADESSLDLLRHLARHTRASGVLILGTYRDELHREHPLEATLLELHRQQLVTQIPVRRMDERGTEALVMETVGEGDNTQRVPAGLLELLHRRSEGNPFFLQELARALVERGDLYRENGRWKGRDIEELAVPERVRAVVQQRLTRLTDPTQEILREASVLGQAFSFDELLEMRRFAGGSRPHRDEPADGGLDRPPHETESRGGAEEEIEEALDEATAAGLVQEIDGDHFAFHHTLTQQVLYEDLSGRRRRRLHRIAAQMLARGDRARREGRTAELAWHRIQADDAEGALPYAILAGDQAEESFAHSEAERLYRMALSIAWEIEPAASERIAGLEAQALEKLGGVLRATGRYDEALEALERAAGAYQETGDREGEQRVIASIGSVHAVTGRINEGIPRLLAAVGAPERETPPSRSPALPLLYSALAQLFAVGGRFRESLATVERASELAKAAGDGRTLAEAQIQRGEALTALGRPEEAREALEQILPLEQAGPLPRALNALGLTWIASGDFEQARLYHEQALEQVERSDPGGLALTLVALARSHFLLGNWDRAEHLLRRADESARSIGGPGVSGQVQLALGSLCVARGNWEEADRRLTEAAEIAPDRELEQLAQIWMAEKDLAQGRPEAAAVRLEPYLGRAIPELLPVLARAFLEMKDVEKAEALAAQAFGRAASRRRRAELAEALWVQGMVRAGQGRTEEATRLLEGGLSLARSMPYPYLEARILYHWGTMQVEQGERQQAREKLERALLLFRRLGAEPYVERLEEPI